jgi:hypothetical protein
MYICTELYAGTSWRNDCYFSFTGIIISLCQIDMPSKMLMHLISNKGITLQIHRGTTDLPCGRHYTEQVQTGIFNSLKYSNLLEPHEHVGAGTNRGLSWTHASALPSH